MRGEESPGVQTRSLVDTEKRKPGQGARAEHFHTEGQGQGARYTQDTKGREKGGGREGNMTHSLGSASLHLHPNLIAVSLEG